MLAPGQLGRMRKCGPPTVMCVSESGRAVQFEFMSELSRGFGDKMATFFVHGDPTATCGRSLPCRIGASMQLDSKRALFCVGGRLCQSKHPGHRFSDRSQDACMRQLGCFCPLPTLSLDLRSEVSGSLEGENRFRQSI